MPDYAIVKNLCEELGITVPELMDGEDIEEKSVRVYDEEHIMELLKERWIRKNRRTSFTVSF